MNKKSLLNILKIPLILGILVQTIISCSSNDDDNGKEENPSSSSVEATQSSSDVGTQGSSSSGGTQSSSSNIVSGTGTGCDIEDYNIVTIGSQTWMAENLNCDVSGSRCYGDGGLVYDYAKEEYIELSSSEIQANCDTHGRLYDWATAMNLPSDCNNNICSEQVSEVHQGICPDGWHIPSNDDWHTLYLYADPSFVWDGGDYARSVPVGKHLRAQNGWAEADLLGDYECLDTYEFAALPSGYNAIRHFEPTFSKIGEATYWWSASESDKGFDAYYWNIDGSGAYMGDRDKSNLLSIRCVKDTN